MAGAPKGMRGNGVNIGPLSHRGAATHSWPRPGRKVASSSPGTSPVRWRAEHPTSGSISPAATTCASRWSTRRTTSSSSTAWPTACGRGSCPREPTSSRSACCAGPCVTVSPPSTSPDPLGGAWPSASSSKLADRVLARTLNGLLEGSRGRPAAFTRNSPIHGQRPTPGATRPRRPASSAATAMSPGLRARPGTPAPRRSPRGRPRRPGRTRA